MSKQAFKRVRRRLRMEVNRTPLDSWAWPGGYPMYYICADGGCLCPDCANRNINLVDAARADRDKQWDIVAADVNYEDPCLICDNCNNRIESAYGGSQVKIKLLQGDFGFCFEVALIHDNGKRVRHEEWIDPPPIDARRKQTKMVEDETILIQSDWEYPSLARNFGWDMRRLQKCHVCDKIYHDQIATQDDLNSTRAVFQCECGNVGGDICQHDSTDGTVPCRDCGLTQTNFISAAHDWLTDHIGDTAEDPGYFQ